MPKGLSVERFLRQAEEREGKYEWLEAVESYKNALSLLRQSEFLKVGDVYEHMSYAFYRAAMQSGSSNEFRSRMSQVIVNCERARASYAKLSAAKRVPLMLRCDAMIALAHYWLGYSMLERKRHADECWQLTTRALELFKESSNALEYGLTYNRFASSVLLGFFAEWDYGTRRKRVTEAVESGEQAVKFLSTCGNSRELAAALVKVASFREMFGFYFLDLEARKGEYQRALDCWLRANELSEETAYNELLNSFAMAMLENPEWEWGTEKTLANIKKALSYSKKTRDNLTIGLALDWLGFHALFNAETCEDPKRRVELTKKALQYAEDAKRNYSRVCFVSPLWGPLWVESPLAGFYFDLAACATNLNERRGLLEKAKDASMELLNCAYASTYPEIIMYAHHVFSDVLFSIAHMETNPDKRQQLLEEVMTHSDEAVRIIEQFIPYYYWKRGKMQNSLADIKSELADLYKDFEVKKSLLEEAVMGKERTVKLVAKYVNFWESIGSIPPLVANLAEWQFQCGVLLSRLGEFTNNIEYLKKAVKTFEEAAASFMKLNLFSYIAQCYWKKGQTSDVLEDYLTAAADFDTASKYFRRASKTIPQLSQFYQDYARYMYAWAEIEKARRNHKKQDYELAREHFKKASKIHRMLKQWSYLALNYDAWAELESAEALSIREQSEKAFKTFTNAIAMFNETKNSLQTQLSRIEDRDEIQMVASIIKAASFRTNYCRGRMAIEEARILDRKGDHYSSSEKYSSAAENFEKIIQNMESEHYRNELEFILILCRAWQKMTKAEAEVSPSLYIEASELFEQAKEFSVDERSKMLALGHSHFCKALASGTKFVDTRDKRLYAVTLQHLEIASNYYLKAGFKNAVEYGKGIELLFEAYIHIDAAKKEREPEKKVKLFMMAKKILESSAESFLKARHFEKREQVLKLIEKVTEERTLALSLTEALHAPAIITAASTFPTPSPTNEKAVGLEQFEHANIQAYLVAPREVEVGETFEVRLDMTNVGKEPGLLVRIEDLVSSVLKISGTIPKYNFDESSIDVKGKQLEPQRIESILLQVTASESGITHLSPKIVYIDSRGNFKTCQANPTTLTIYPIGKFQFRTVNAQKVFDYLVKAFSDDYMRKRMPLEKSGWRTLMQIVKNAHVSKSSIYGTGVHRGVGMTELERRGVVEVRIFSEERGRGGKIAKARIAYEKDIVKRYVDQQVMKIK